MLEQYKNEIMTAREHKLMSVLFLIYEAAKEDFYNDKITANEYTEIRKMILGLCG